ncbi:MAG TPA: uroporphyrinogen decarboxylase family protein [bacterium]|nr:uroporphyrinogen decarboxylase family protein [bacterium]
MMTSREIVDSAVNFRGPERIPIDYWILPATHLKYGGELAALLAEFPKDFPDHMEPEPDGALPPSHRKGVYTDCFGAVWTQEQEGILGQVLTPPLGDWKALGEHPFPDPSDGEITLQQLKSITARSVRENKYTCVDFIRTFERMHFLRGMQNLLMDMALGEKEYLILLDRVAEWNTAHLRIVLDELHDDIDGIWFSDDWGAQKSLFINPVKWREIFKPVYRKMFDVVKEYQKTIFFHSDGFILDIIDDFIEIGVDALNCQVKLMGEENLAERFGGKITFHTDLDRQHILPHGTTEDIRNHVQSVIKHLGKYSGGLILNAEIGPDVPFENIRTLLENTSGGK